MAKPKGGFSVFNMVQQSPATLDEIPDEVVEPVAQPVIVQTPQEMQNLNDVKPQRGNKSKAKHEYIRSSLYTTQAQEEKIVDIIAKCRKRFKRRVDRQEIIRALLDAYSVDEIIKILVGVE